MKRLISLLCFVVAIPLLAQEKANPPNEVQRDFGNDHFVAGKLIIVDRAVSGDLIAAGSEMEVAASVTGDALLAGGTVVVSKAINQSLYAAAGKLLINDSVKRNVRVAGGRIEFSPISEVAGNVTAMGGEVELKGKVNGYVQAVGGRVFIDAIILGNVEATSGQVELGPNARITGTFRYSSREPLKRDPAAQTNGGIQVFAAAGGWPVPENVEHHMGRGGSWIWTIGLLLVAALLMVALPSFYARVVDTLRHRMRMSLLIGFVTLVCVPIAAIFFLITIIGVPLGLITLMLYLLLLIVGYVTTGISLGDWLLKRVKSSPSNSTLWRVGAAVVGVLVVSLLARIPWVGPWVSLIALLAGIGALVLQTSNAWGSRNSTSPT
jgi:hypothetical protein